MWTRAKKAHIEKKPPTKKSTRSKPYKSPVGQGQPMGFHLPHKKYITICGTGPTNQTNTMTRIGLTTHTCPTTSTRTTTRTDPMIQIGPTTRTGPTTQTSPNTGQTRQHGWAQRHGRAQRPRQARLPGRAQ